MGEMAGRSKSHSQSLTVSAGPLLPLIFISFYTWSHMVSISFEAISTEWGKQISRSGQSHLGVFKENIQDKLKVLIHFRAVSHAARQRPGCVAGNEIVPAVFTAFAMAWSMAKVLPFPPPWMAALLHSSWDRAAFLPWHRQCSQPPAVCSACSVWVAHACDHGWRKRADLVCKCFSQHLSKLTFHPVVPSSSLTQEESEGGARLWVCCCFLQSCWMVRTSELNVISRPLNQPGWVLWCAAVPGGSWDQHQWDMLRWRCWVALCV